MITLFLDRSSRIQMVHARNVLFLSDRRQATHRQLFRSNGAPSKQQMNPRWSHVPSLRPSRMPTGKTEVLF
jgi:hypothetical protein